MTIIAAIEGYLSIVSRQSEKLCRVQLIVDAAEILYRR